MDVDFSDLLRVIKQMELQAQHKDCPYCEKRMKTTLIEKKDDLRYKGASFRCLNCGYYEPPQDFELLGVEDG